MTEVQDIFVLAEKALTRVVEQIKDDRWDRMKPDWFSTGAQGDVDLRHVVAYHAYDDAWVPDVLAGKTLAEVGDKYEHLKGDDPRPAWHGIVDQAIAAVEALADTAKTVHLTYGDFPAGEYLKHVTSAAARWFRARSCGHLERPTGVGPSEGCGRLVVAGDEAHQLRDQIGP